MSTSTDQSHYDYNCIGIVYGSGDYPRKVLEACQARGLRCCVATVSDADILGVLEASEGTADADAAPISVPVPIPIMHAKLGKIGAIIRFFRENGVDAVVFAGAVKRPSINELSLDSKGASWLLKLGRSVFGGDDELLRAIAELLKQEGFAVISGTDLFEDTFLGSGVFSREKPTEQEWHDIRKGFEIAKTVGRLDIGQSVIVCCGDVLGIECVEGTDELIKRCAKLRKQQSGGILVKVSKPQQDQRLDLPTVGPKTLENLHHNGFRGLAVESDRCIILDRERMIEAADHLSMVMVSTE